MPSILVVPDHPDADRAGEFHFKERVAASLLGDPHFAAQLIERLAWAIGDGRAGGASARWRAAYGSRGCPTGTATNLTNPGGSDPRSRERETDGRSGPGGRSANRRLQPRHNGPRNLPARRDARGRRRPGSGIGTAARARGGARAAPGDAGRRIARSPRARPDATPTAGARPSPRSRPRRG